jgi:RNA polymerase sigma-70 factor (ECF subfamily)
MTSDAPPAATLVHSVVSRERAANAREDEAFIRATEPFRRELLAHCYRMLGSVDDAEDLVQETYVRAWRAYGGFEGRSSARAWLYRIATNACLNVLKQRRIRRVLPSGLGPPSDDPCSTPIVAAAGVSWLQPLPDADVNGDSDDPAAIVASRETLRLALVASLQYLPARQRAVLLLRDVLAFSAAEVAEMLDTTTAAVKSTLQRARARLDEARPSLEHVDPLRDSEEQALLRRYIVAFEQADAAALEQLLCDDATLEATPVRTWFAGRATCIPYLVARVLGSPGQWWMLPTRANGHPAAVAFRRDEGGTYLPYGVVVLTPAHDGIAHVHAFGEPGLVTRFRHVGTTGSRAPSAEARDGIAALTPGLSDHDLQAPPTASTTLPRARRCSARSAAP